MNSQAKLFKIVNAFKIHGNILDITPLGNGLINDTLKVVTPDKAYVLQRINHSIFKDVDLLQHNIEVVTNHIREKGHTSLEFIQNKENGKTYYKDDEGNYWRVSLFINDSVTYEAVNPEYSEKAGRAFGEFEAMLVDVPEQLGETIPDFHNMSLRLSQIREAVQADPAHRVSEVKELLELVEKYGDEICKADRLYAEGKLPKRICHCDTKVNNMLFNKNGDFLCVIDLDTVMPSFVFSDFGDFMRTAANPVAEDSPELDKVDVKMDIFKAFAKGYLEGAKSFITPIEKENLPYAVRLFAFMQCVRFLCDYINGDTYYKIQYPEHNLVRAKNQMQLFLSATKKEKEMKDFINSL